MRAESPQPIHVRYVIATDLLLPLSQYAQSHKTKVGRSSM